ncbi:MAG: hypothetical protein WC976_06785 [Caldisericia bacterium]
MKAFTFTTKAAVEITAMDEEEARKIFWVDIEGQPQQTACDWINEHTDVTEGKLKQDPIEIMRELISMAEVCEGSEFERTAKELIAKIKKNLPKGK